MIHKEFTLTVKETIYERLDSTTKAVAYKKGDCITIGEENFNRLKAGETIAFAKIAGHGMYASVEYDKYNFENEVAVNIIETSTAIAKLGQRK